MRGGGEGGGNSVGGSGGGEVVKEISSDGEWEKRIRLLGRAFPGSACLLNLLVTRGWDDGRGSCRCLVQEETHHLNCCQLTILQC